LLPYTGTVMASTFFSTSYRVWTASCSVSAVIAHEPLQDAVARLVYISVSLWRCQAQQLERRSRSLEAA
jgi:hypothetical protein